MLVIIVASFFQGAWLTMAHWNPHQSGNRLVHRDTKYSKQQQSYEFFCNHNFFTKFHGESEKVKRASHDRCSETKNNRMEWP